MLLIIYGAQPIEVMAKKAHRMFFQRQAGGHIIFRHVFAELHRWQYDFRLREKLIAHVANEERKRMVGHARPSALSSFSDPDRVEPARSPQRGAAIEPQRAKGIRIGEPLDGES